MGKMPQGNYSVWVLFFFSYLPLWHRRGKGGGGQYIGIECALYSVQYILYSTCIQNLPMDHVSPVDEVCEFGRAVLRQGKSIMALSKQAECRSK